MIDGLEAAGGANAKAAAFALGSTSEASVPAEETRRRGKVHSSSVDTTVELLGLPARARVVLCIMEAAEERGEREEDASTCGEKLAFEGDWGKVSEELFSDDERRRNSGNGSEKLSAVDAR